MSSRSTSSANATTPADPVNDASGAPKRTRLRARRRLRILLTEKVPLPFGDQGLDNQTRWSLGHSKTPVPSRWQAT